jgi:hypothetical protein
MVNLTRPAAALSVAVVAFVAAWRAMLPGVAFWDTGELQAVAPLLGTGHPTGFPTYVVLGWLASIVLQPFGEPAFRMNLFSGLCLAVAAGVTVDLVRALTGRVALGIAAGIGLALTPIAWTIATHAETHTLNLALVAILLWLLVGWDTRVRAASEAPTAAGTGGATVAMWDRPVDRGDRFLVAAAVVFGLAVGNHSLTLLLAIPVGLYVLAVDPDIWRRGRLVLACVAALVLTVVLVYLELPLRAGPFRAPLVYGTPNTWDGFRYIVLAEQFQGSLSDPFGHLDTKLGSFVSLLVAQFGILAPLVPVAFVVTAVKRWRYALLTGTAVAITCFFNASYVNADISRYYVGPALMAWTWLAIMAGAIVDVLVTAGAIEPATEAEQATEPGPTRERDPVTEPQLASEPEPAAAGLATADAASAPAATLDGAEAVAARSPSSADGRRAAGIRVALISGLVGFALVVPTLGEVPARFRALDVSSRREAAVWLDHVLDVMDRDAMIVSWWSYSTPLWYAQRVEGRRPDIEIMDDRTRLDENLGGLTDVIDANLGKRPVYVMRLDPREVALLAERYELDYIDGRDATALTKVIGLRNASS